MKLVKSRPKRRPLEIPDEARRILHRVGLALFAFGLLDIAVMIYCLANAVSYSSSFNIFAVISGIYLWRGHPWYVKCDSSRGLLRHGILHLGPRSTVHLPDGPWRPGAAPAPGRRNCRRGGIHWCSFVPDLGLSGTPSSLRVGDL
jgi:hypothetical protein